MILDLIGIDTSNMTLARLDMMKVKFISTITKQYKIILFQCDIVVKEYWRDFYPHLNEKSSEVCIDDVFISCVIT